MSLVAHTEQRPRLLTDSSTWTRASLGLEIMRNTSSFCATDPAGVGHQALQSVQEPTNYAPVRCASRSWEANCAA